MCDMGIYAITDFAELAGQNAAVSAINAALTASNAATEVAGSTLTPPGGEGASIRAVSQQLMAVQQFAMMFNMGMEQLQERVAATTMFGGAAEATEMANAASLAF